MEWLTYYFLFALSGAMVTWIQIYMPSISLVRIANPDHVMCRHWCIATIVWMSIAIVFIPILALPLLDEEMKENFIYNLTEGFLKK
jgi:hypothetical protein